LAESCDLWRRHALHARALPFALALPCGSGVAVCARGLLSVRLGNRDIPDIFDDVTAL
jgi:hypothetical protein